MPAERHNKPRMKRCPGENCSKQGQNPAGFHFTVKDLSQSLVFRLGVAKLDVFVRVPGEAGAPQRDPGHIGRRLVIEQIEGV